MEKIKNLSNEIFENLMKMYLEVIGAWDEPIYKKKAKSTAEKEFEKFGISWEEMDRWYFENSL